MIVLRVLGDRCATPAEPRRRLRHTEVGGATTICAALTSKPIPAKSVAVAVIISGAAITYDMSVSR